MYERVDWWLGRSISGEYQEAYDKIAKYREIPSDAAILDCCCGNGELIKRLHKQGKEKEREKGRLEFIKGLFQRSKERLIVGADHNPIMLQLAQSNLFSEAIPTNIVDINDLESAMSSGGVLLVQDDIICSRLPPKSFDYVFNTFPDIVANRPTQRMLDYIGIELSRDYFKLKRTLSPDHSDLKKILSPDHSKRIQEEAIFLQTHFQVWTALKKGGIYIEVLYGKPLSEQDVKSYVSKSFQGKFKLLSSEFVENPAIAADKEEAQATGYRILELQKIVE